jgi:hypothetical protein
MNNQFDELTKSLAQSVTRRAAVKQFGLGLAGIALTSLLTLPASADNVDLGPMVEISRPNAVGTCDDGASVVVPGPWTLEDAAEPYLAVNPVNPKNIVAAWIQGPYQNTVVATSFDGGRMWQQALVPFTVCSGGPFLLTGDPWLSFARNGDLYLIDVSGDAFDYRGIAITKSVDGGLHWSQPVLVYGPADASALGDKPSITADPRDPRMVYVVWDVFNSDDNSGQTYFTRTTDGGETWEPSRSIYVPGTSTDALDHVILVLPNGALVCLFEEIITDPITGDQEISIALIRSTDQGQTWSGRIPVAREFLTPTIDLENGQTVISDNQGFALDPRNGNLYAVWPDARFNNFEYTSIAFSMSADGGFTWSQPMAINQTPGRLPAGNRQAFVPNIAVAADGTIGVTYYDFRFNDSRPGLPTDYWLVRCHPSPRQPATDPASWGGEVRLTSRSFDMEKAWAPFFDYFLGDYEGLMAIGEDFLSVFDGVDRDNVTSVFFRRIEQ